MWTVASGAREEKTWTEIAALCCRFQRTELCHNRTRVHRVAAFNTTLQLDEPAEVVYERIRRSLQQGVGSAHVRAQPGLIVVTRRFTPTWAKVLGVIGLLLFLIGALFFLVKEEESLSISISPSGERRCTVMVAGNGETWLIARVQSAITQPQWLTRPCPHCQAAMKPDATKCPHCESESRAWVRKDGRWWYQSDTVGWQWLDEGANAWRIYVAPEAESPPHVVETAADAGPPLDAP